MNRTKSRLLTGFAQVTCLLVIGVAVAAPGCNLLGGSCPSMDGNVYSGAGGAGGGGDDDGFGGGDGGDPDQGNVGGVGPVGAGGGSSFDTGAGAGDSSDVGAGAGSEHGGPGHHRRRVRRHRHGSGLGTAVQADQADCTPLNVPPPPSMMPPVPNWVGLDTMTLRQIAIANNIKNCAMKTGIGQNRAIGITFETWVLKTKGQLPRWSMPIFSMERQTANKQNGNGGLPKSVIPEFVGTQVKVTLNSLTSVTWDYFPNSMFYEVKAVNAALTLGYSKGQILGFLDGLTTFPTVPPPPAAHAPPVLIFTTTSNTTVATDVVTQALAWGVAVWQQKVLYDANSATPNNPLLRLDQVKCLTPALYPTTTLTWIDPGTPWPDNPLTWPTDPEQDAVAAVPDPDDPAVVP